jgi:hypothetical protein
VRVFISWSGEKSRLVAVALRDWLPLVIQEVDPFVSDRDIAAGANWRDEIMKQLAETSFGIVCVTREGQSSEWLNFEAGAVAKQIESSRVVPLAIDLKMTDIKQPLGSFHGKDISKAGILGLLESLNDVATTRLPNLPVVFEKWWPDLEAALDSATAMATTDTSAPLRDERDLIEELLGLVRAQQAQLNSPPQGPWATRIARERAFANAVVSAIGDLLPDDVQIAPSSDRNGHFHIATPQQLPAEVCFNIEQRANSLGATVDFAWSG